MKIDSVLITELKNNTYYAVIRLSRSTKFWDVDARPSDAIAMAVRSTIPMFVEEEVMNVGSYKADEEGEDADVKSIYSVADELDKLKEDLKKAVDTEDYEKAASLRDRIRDMESGSSNI